MVFSTRLAAGGVETEPGGSSRAPYHFANLASHVGDDPSAVLANRNKLAGALGVAAEDLAFMHPDHGRGVAWIGREALPGPVATGARPPTGTAPGAEVPSVDALITAQVGIGLVALSADCVPILLVSAHPVLVGAVHSGWRGVLADVTGAAISEFVAAGAQPEAMRAWLGPAICGSCYPVPEQRAAQVGAVAPQALAQAADGQPALDLRKGIAAQLRGLGVTVETVGGCTVEDLQLYSHRRDGLTGRAGAAIAVLAGAGS